MNSNCRHHGKVKDYSPVEIFLLRQTSGSPLSKRMNATPAAKYIRSLELWVSKIFLLTLFALTQLN
jgi:hypothetical protein